MRHLLEPAQPGWIGRWAREVAALRVAGAGLLYLGCTVEILAAGVIAWAVITAPKP